MLGKGELLCKPGDSRGRIAGVTLDVSELKQAQVELQQLAKRLMEAQEEERRRISRELHDDIGQRVALLAIELDLIRQQLDGQTDLRERVERAQAATDELGSDLHQLSHTLHSSKLQYLGLPAALRELCTRIGEKHGLAVTMELDEARFVLAEESSLTLYRVAQEALNNVVRHSGATEARVTLSHSPGEVRLVISDNGQGFDPTRKNSGIGLIGMRERLRAIQGDLLIISGPEGGSTFQVRVPRMSPKPQAKRVRAGSLS
jgi:signal transduction histidine kinase